MEQQRQIDRGLQSTARTAGLQIRIAGGDQAGSGRAAEAWPEAGPDPLEAVEQGLREGLSIVGDKLERMEVFLPQLTMAARAGNAVMEVLQPTIKESGQQAESPGTVLLGPAKGDIHMIGKDIVGVLFWLAGFEVYDLGVDVPPATTFFQQASKVRADIIAPSALMTSTMPGQRHLINLLRDVGERDKYAVIVGGAPVTQGWADRTGSDRTGSDRTGSDGYSETASGGVELSLGLAGK